MKFVNKTRHMEALKFTGSNADELMQELGIKIYKWFGKGWIIKIKSGSASLKVGDYIGKDDKGTIHILKEDDILDSYEVIND